MTDNDMPLTPEPPRTIRPETFGAVGDGYTDDTAALQAALDYAAATDQELEVVAGRGGTGGTSPAPEISD